MFFIKKIQKMLANFFDCSKYSKYSKSNLKKYSKLLWTIVIKLKKII